MAWRLANSLVRLRDQVNAAYPARSKASDGTIGNAAHAATASDHNPNSKGVVCAMDITNDPAHGLDVHALADRLRVNRHPNLKYIISNRRIAGAWTNWNWVNYTGSNPHDKHAHFSVGNTGSGDGKSTSNYDDSRDWNISGASQGGFMAKVTLNTARILAETILGRDRAGTHAGKGDADLLAHHVGAELSEQYIYNLWMSNEAHAAVADREAKKAFYDKYSKLVGDLEARPTKEQLTALQTQLTKEAEKVAKAEAALKDAQAKQSEDTILLDNAGSSLTKLFNRLFKRG